jgi:hypothetical protein
MCVSYRPLALLFVTLLLSSASVAFGQPNPLEYNRDIRPILAENCFACHGADSAARQSDLRIDRREDAIEYGAIVPESPADSELIARILTDDPDLVMPPPETKKSLSPAQKQMLRDWIAAGAPYEPHWSFIPPRRPATPSVGNEAWVRNAIDRFILTRLEAAALAPAPEADPRTLFRRVHLDITGLPPNPEEVEAFAEDYVLRKDLALSDAIDRLMKLPTWGEHRARYWLDAARYADTHGLHFDNYREMWPYRDWVIRAFNANQPFDQFVVDQLAGDLLPNPDDDQLIATGFQRCNITTNEGGTIDEENLANYASDRVQTFGWVFLGLTTNCAQCHDHKFDPITMRDYYSLAAFFRNSEAPAKDGNVKDGQGPVLVVPGEADRPRWEAIPGEIAQAESRLSERRAQARADFEQWLPRATAQQIDQSPEDGLVIHLPLNEGSGQEVRNLAGDPASLRTDGKVNWSTPGKLGPAPRIQQGSTFKIRDGGDFERDQPFSCGAWYRAESQGAQGAIVARMDPQHKHRGWDLWQNGSGYAVHLIDSWADNAIKVITQDGTVTPGQWQHVCMTYDGSGTPQGIKLYVDGKLLALSVATNTLQADASIRTETPLRIGQRRGGAVLEGSSVQDVRIYDRQLDDAEVTRVAGTAHLQSLLATPPDQRDQEQRAQLLEYYLQTVDREYPVLQKVLTDLRVERESIRGRSPITHIQRERADSPPMAHLLMRGQYDQPGEQVPAAVPAALHPLPNNAPGNRLGLAQWVVDEANPLTARVTVNRFWQEVFGQGLVTTAEDFGVSGALPSHPELLDWLAIDFVENGWDVKRTFKSLFMSATYRQAAVTTPEKLHHDPANRLLSWGPRYRMDAEMVRDYALAVSDLLSPRMYGPGTKPYQPEDIWSIVGLPGGDTRSYVQDRGENLYRRTVYNFWKRMAPPPSLEAFNAPSREVCTVNRERTNTPLQALVTLNDPQFVEAARHLAQLALREGRGEDRRILDTIAKRVLSRSFTAEEQDLLLDSRKVHLEYYQAHPDDAAALIAVGESPVPVGLDAADLASWSMICNQVLNLDEALNK